MNEAKFFEELKKFCIQNELAIKYKFHVGKSIAVVLFGKDSIKLFDEWLKHKNIIHTTPISCDDGIMSYITL